MMLVHKDEDLSGEENNVNMKCIIRCPSFSLDTGTDEIALFVQGLCILLFKISSTLTPYGR
jgi:hypothetical protein